MKTLVAACLSFSSLAFASGHSDIHEFRLDAHARAHDVTIARVQGERTVYRPPAMAPGPRPLPIYRFPEKRRYAGYALVIHGLSVDAIPRGDFVLYQENATAAEAQEFRTLLHRALVEGIALRGLSLHVTSQSAPLNLWTQKPADASLSVRPAQAVVLDAPTHGQMDGRDYALLRERKFGETSLPAWR
jgi:hypothetical protein